MNQQIEITEKVAETAVVRSFNLEVPIDFHTKLYEKYLETSEKHEKLLRKASPYAYRRSSHKLAFRSFLRDLFYTKIESGEWKL